VLVVEEARAWDGITRARRRTTGGERARDLSRVIMYDADVFRIEAARLYVVSGIRVL
jgi:hypothetical protein